MSGPMPAAHDAPANEPANESVGAAPDRGTLDPVAAVEAPIVSVTVYPDQARVTRRGSVELPPGRHRVHVEPLPLRIQADSVRVGGEGAATVLGVDVVRRSYSRTTDPEVAELEGRRRAVAAEVAALADADAVHKQHFGFLAALNQRSSATFARALASRETDPAAVAATAAAIAEQMSAVNARRRENAARQQDVEADLAAIDRRLAQPDNPSVPDRMAAAVDLEVGADPAGNPTTTVHLELSYLVTGAGWSSVYDIRVDGQRLALTWFGLVTQRTGEDWPEGELLLSTARPSGRTSVPELTPWYLDRFQPAPYPASMPMYGAAGGPMPPGMPPMPPGMPQTAVAPGGAPAPAAAVPAPPPPLRQATADVEHGVSASTYRTTRPVAVPADGTAHRATVAVMELDASLDYVTAPVTAAEAHLRATVVNRSTHTLLPGPASVFSSGVFVGRTSLGTWAPGEEVELALGVDDRIRVERTMVGRRASRATLGSTRRREAEYRVLVTNHTASPARVTVLDQLPVSRDENIVVRELHLHPAPQERTELGILTWRFEVPPGGVAEVLLGLRVEVSRSVEMVGWRE